MTAKKVVENLLDALINKDKFVIPSRYDDQFNHDTSIKIPSIFDINTQLNVLKTYNKEEIKDAIYSQYKYKDTKGKETQAHGTNILVMAVTSYICNSDTSNNANEKETLEATKGFAWLITDEFKKAFEEENLESQHGLWYNKHFLTNKSFSGVSEHQPIDIEFRYNVMQIGKQSNAVDYVGGFENISSEEKQLTKTGTPETLLEIGKNLLNYKDDVKGAIKKIEAVIEKENLLPGNKNINVEATNIVSEIICKKDFPTTTIGSAILKTIKKEQDIAKQKERNDLLVQTIVDISGNPEKQSTNKVEFIQEAMELKFINNNTFSTGYEKYDVSKSKSVAFTKKILKTKQNGERVKEIIKEAIKPKSPDIEI